MEEKPKALPHIPFFRRLSYLPQAVKNPIPVFLRHLKEFGGIYSTKVTFGNHIIVTDRPEIIRHILQKNHRNYTKSDVQKKLLARQVGHGLLTSEGNYWLRQRRLIQPGFHKRKIAALVKTMLAETNLFMETLPLEEPIDISKAMMRLTFKVVSRSLFSAGLQEKDLDRIDFIITELQHYVITQARQPYLIPWLILSGKRRYYARLKAEADKILFGIIESRRQSGEQNDDLLNMLLESRYEDTGEGMSDLQLKDESLILFVAGHETSANALAWTWYLLSRHPEVERKLLEEVLEVLGERDVTFEDLHRLPYTLQVIQESMRLFPPAWAIDRQAIEEDVAGGFRIPKGSIVLLFLYGVHHSPDLWEDPERFDPDRFAGEGMKNRSDFTYFPFGGGPRLCIGNQFALMEMQVVLAQMIRKFRFELLEGQLIEGQPLITFRPKYGIRMRLKARMPQDAVLKA